MHIPRRIVIMNGAASLWAAFSADEPSLSSTQRVQPYALRTIEDCVGLIQTSCPSEFVQAVVNSGRIFYRGEANARPEVLSPKPDLLILSTYNDQTALDFFECLERKLAAADVKARPRTGHIGTARLEDARRWGRPVSVWPLGGRINYVWPKDRDFIYPGYCSDQDLIIDRDLETALVEGKEILFATTNEGLWGDEPSFLAIPAASDRIVMRLLVNNHVNEA